LGERIGRGRRCIGDLETDGTRQPSRLLLDRPDAGLLGGQNRAAVRRHQNFTHDGDADDAGIFAALIIFERHLNPTLVISFGRIG
jgi:hypothetical protein